MRGASVQAPPSSDADGPGRPRRGLGPTFPRHPTQGESEAAGGPRRKHPSSEGIRSASPGLEGGPEGGDLSKLCGPTVTRKDLGVRDVPLGACSPPRVSREGSLGTPPPPPPLSPVPGLAKQHPDAVAGPPRDLGCVQCGGLEVRPCPPREGQSVAAFRGIRLEGPWRGGRGPPSPRRSPCNSSGCP